MKTSSTTASDKSTSGKRVLLVCPPYQSLTLSSLSIAQLATYLKKHGVQSREAYLHLDFIALLGQQEYAAINDAQEGRGNGQSAELLFAEGLHGKISDAEQEAILEKLIGNREERRALLEKFENAVTERIKYERPEIVGITTSYNQLMAALWLTKKIKQIDSDIRVVLGGTACGPPMGAAIADAYPMVDWVVSGHGELPLLQLARGETPRNRLIQNDIPVELDELPLPEYRPYLRELGVRHPEVATYLIFQSSRGCWWGHKRHCKFCGLNGGQMTFHAKPSDQVLKDIRTLYEQTGCNLIACDSIMAREHLKELVPKLARFQEKPRIFYEMKANMREDEVIAMAEANVVGQMGIESLSTRLLKLMRKGLTTIRALALLKWSREHTVAVMWNQLCGIPGETVEDYDTQIELMTKIPHFKPPFRVNPVVIDRYSPYFDDYEEYGWTSLSPVPQYRAAHPHLDDAALRRIAYHFQGEGGVTTDAYIERFEAAVETWKARHEKRDGLYWSRYEGLTKIDDGAPERILVNETVRDVIEATHRIVSVERILNQVGCDSGLIDEMVENGFLYVEKGNVINLTARSLSR